MNIDDVLSSLTFSEKTLTQHIDNIPKKHRKSAKSLIEASVRIAYILFSIADSRRARMIVEPISKIQFSNSYDYWTWIEAALVLQGHIAKAAGEEAIYQQALDTVNLALQTGTELQVNVKNNVHRRFLEGQTLDAGFLDEADKRVAFEMRVNYLMTLLKIRFFGGSETWSVTRLDTEIHNVTLEISNTVTEVGFNNLPPFK